MDFELNEEQEVWRREVRAFIAANADDDLRRELREHPRYGPGPHYQRWLHILSNQGWLAIGWPKDYGGQGRGFIDQWIMIEEMEYAGVPLIMPMGLTIVGPMMVKVADDEMKKDWLPRILRGEVEFALGYSEPNAGTDLASLQTRADIDGDDFIINGQKTWNSGAHFATHELLAVRTDSNAPKHQGISLVIVSMDTPGISVRPLWTWGEHRTNETFFDNVRVPRRNLVGKLNEGWQYLANALDFERVAIGITGDIRRLFESLVSAVRETRRNGRPLAEDPIIRSQLASIAADIDVCSLLALRAIWMVQNGRVIDVEASIVKVLNSELRAKLGDVGMQMMGPYGQLKTGSILAPLEGAIELLYRVAPMKRFGGGANEIQRDIIARRGLGLPRG